MARNLSGKQRAAAHRSTTQAELLSSSDLPRPSWRRRRRAWQEQTPCLLFTRTLTKLTPPTLHLARHLYLALQRRAKPRGTHQTLEAVPQAGIMHRRWEDGGEHCKRRQLPHVQLSSMSTASASPAAPQVSGREPRSKDLTVCLSRRFSGFPVSPLSAVCAATSSSSSSIHPGRHAK